MAAASGFCIVIQEFPGEPAIQLHLPPPPEWSVWSGRFDPVCRSLPKIAGGHPQFQNRDLFARHFADRNLFGMSTRAFAMSSTNCFIHPPHNFMVLEPAVRLAVHSLCRGSIPYACVRSELPVVRVRRVLFHKALYGVRELGTVLQPLFDAIMLQHDFRRRRQRVVVSHHFQVAPLRARLLNHYHAVERLSWRQTAPSESSA